jgi:ABC-2 type transport system ATP-binding protein
MIPALEITNLRKAYKNFILKDVSFTLPPGFIMGMIGANGAGKTTIIKLIMNLIRRDGGEIRIFGMDNRREEAAARQRIGFVFDTPSFIKDIKLSVIAAGIAPFYAGWDQGTFLELAREFDLPLNKTVKKLSQGMQTKFALALALSHNADLILMDEPTTGLDPVFRRELLGRLAGIIQDQGKSILFSTHITTDLEKTADYIALIRDGELLFCRTREELQENFGLVKGGIELLDESLRPLWVSLKKNEYGVTALTADRPLAVRLLRGRGIVERATLDDILLFMNNGAHHDAKNTLSRLAV